MSGKIQKDFTTGSIGRHLIEFCLPFLLSNFIQACYSVADMLIVGGTSLAVYPAAGLIDYFNGKNLVLINKSETSADRRADIVIHEAIGEVFTQVMENL